jgi:hypothetical protein
LRPPASDDGHDRGREGAKPLPYGTMRHDRGHRGRRGGPCARPLLLGVTKNYFGLSTTSGRSRLQVSTMAFATSATASTEG